MIILLLYIFNSAEYLYYCLVPFLLGQFFNPKTEVNAENLKIRQVRVNSSGTRVAILADQIEGFLLESFVIFLLIFFCRQIAGAMKVFHPDSKLYIYDRNKGAIVTYDFSIWKRSPVNVFWDDADERMICCEALRNRFINNCKKYERIIRSNYR